MPDAGATPLLEVDIAEKMYGRGATRVPAIAGLRFALDKGAVVCLLGPSGCGKSTALRIVMGLDTAYEGSVRPSPAELTVGVVFQDARLLPWRTVEQNIRLAAPDLTPAALEELLDETGLAPWRGHRPNQISGGMARRVALARALAVSPDLLILDEAFVSLDETNAQALRAVVFGAIERRGITVLMVTHDVGEALQNSDTVLVLAPRPTRVLAAHVLTTPRDRRDPSWLAAERLRLAAATSAATADV